MRISITKIQAANGALFSPADPNCHVASTPGTGTESLPVGYSVECDLLEPLMPGAPVIALRHRRNGVPMLGYFTTSVVREIILVTQNSVYKVTLSDPDNS